MNDTKSGRIAVRNIEQETAVAEPVHAYADDEVSAGKVVTLNFALLLENAETIDSNFGRSPVTFIVGDGNLLPGFENVLLGLKAGASGEVSIQADAAFGEINDDNIQKFPRYQFPPDLTLEAGMVINFADKAGNDQAGVIKQFDSAWVQVDFNHPLAGRIIRFKFHIHDVKLQTSNTL